MVVLIKDTTLMNNHMALSDAQLDDLMHKKYIVIDNFLPLADYQQLKIEATEQTYHNAQIHHGLDQEIRSDGIAWIEQDTVNIPNNTVSNIVSNVVNQQIHGNGFIKVLQALAQQLNQNFFVGIQRAEAHFACYGAGNFYKKHRDNPKGSDNRVFSCVFYMNDDWQVGNGGELIMHIKKEQHTLSPLANRMVIFDSDVPHEVAINHRRRYSIACWLRRDA